MLLLARLAVGPGRIPVENEDLFAIPHKSQGGCPQSPPADLE